MPLRYIALAVAGVLIVGAGAVFGVDRFLNADAGGGGQTAPASPQGTAAAPIDPSRVTVSVLNGTTVDGLAGQIGDEVEAAGFQRGNVTNATDQERAESVILYAPGASREGRAVARKLDISQTERVDPESRGLAGDASVVVIVGADQAE